MISRSRKFCSHWHLTEGTNIVEIFKPLYIVFLLLGLYPCSVTFPKGKYSNIEPGSVVINIICAFLTISCITICLAVNIDDRTSRSVSVSNINYFIETALLITSTVVGYFCIYFYRHGHINMLNTVMLTWSELANNDSMDILKQFRFMTWTLVLGWIIVPLGGYTVLSSLNQFSLWMIVTVILPEIVPSGVIVLYNIMGLMVAGLLTNINQQCGQLAGNDNQLSNTGFIRVRHKQVRMTVSQLELAYKKALKIKREINKAFQAILLVFTLQSFQALLYEAHTLYHGVMKSNSFGAISVVQSVHWIIYQTLKMYAISFPGTKIEDEENQIGQTLLCIPAEDVQMYTEVQHFSSLMTFQETQMTAYGYFALDATLVFNTFAAVATYLVILVQFDS